MARATAFANLVKMTVSGTPGTGTITLGPAVAPFFGTSELTDGGRYAYQITDGANVATGHGVYTASGTTLTRDASERCNVGGTPQSTPMSLTSAAVVTFTGILAEDITPISVGSVNISPAGAYAKEVTVADANVKTTSRIICAVSGTFPGGAKYSDELELEPAWAYGRCLVDGTLRVRLVGRGPLWPAHTVNYQIF